MPALGTNPTLWADRSAVQIHVDVIEGMCTAEDVHWSALESTEGVHWSALRASTGVH